MNKKECLRCRMDIDLDKERYVLLRTNKGKKIIQEVYFHITCWKLHFEEKARQKSFFSQSSPPIGACQGIQVNSTFTSFVFPQPISHV